MRHALLPDHLATSITLRDNSPLYLLCLAAVCWPAVQSGQSRAAAGAAGALTGADGAGAAAGKGRGRWEACVAMGGPGLMADLSSKRAHCLLPPCLPEHACIHACCCVTPSPPRHCVPSPLYLPPSAGAGASYLKAWAALKAFTPQQVAEMEECARYLRRSRRGGEGGGCRCGDLGMW